ncbi:nucleoside phosphorylase [Salinibacillus aidingensis]|uniref:Uridine phosphorylase n=1 Tax=Salinibacillus aidingensis TaxID=237684 RepID=A0ABN1AYS1_9BACI
MGTEMQPHLQLTEEIQAKYALLPGDPKRVDQVKKHFHNVKELAFNREYKSIIGEYKGIPVLVVSTGIGGPSAGIAVEELANIGVTTLIRVGSSGSMQNHIHLGDLIVATGAVRDEGTTNAYIEAGFPAVADDQLVSAIRAAASKKNIPYHTGIVRSHDSFYTDKEEQIEDYWSRRRVLGSDMETSTLFVVGALRGIRTASILNVVVPSKGNLQSGINDLVDGESLPIQGERYSIQVALEAIASIHNTF